MEDAAPGQLPPADQVRQFQSSEQNSQTSYFVVYNTDTTEVLAVSENMFHQARRLLAFTFHPTDPFAVSVQRTNLEYDVSFHVWHQTRCCCLASLMLSSQTKDEVNFAAVARLGNTKSQLFTVIDTPGFGKYI